MEIEGDAETWLADQCADAAVDLQMLRSIRAHNAEWKAKTGADNAAKIDGWLALPPADRAARLADLNGVWATKAGELSKRAPKGDGYAEAAQAMLGWCAHLQAQVGLARFAALYAGALSAGRAYSAAYALAKRRRAVVDFDDLIRRAARLLAEPGIGDWIRFKLDARIDHVLVDEAQDTNRAQWDIIEAVTEDFFAGKGARDGKLRTVFTVGDFKQAIFGFQGTDPQQYRAARERLHERIERLASDADRAEPRELARLDLATSFRSTEPILKLVDALVHERGHETFGLESPVAPHVGVKPDVGEVMLLRPVRPIDDDAAEEDEESWLAEEKLNYAKKLARQIREWIDQGRVLATTGKPLQAGDIMILVRRRSELAALLVARLYAENVPVAGVDRLRLGQPLAVKDLLAAIRFAVQPEDDLNLAELLVSPLLGWSQDDLLAAAYRTGEARGLSLWRHLRGQADRAEAIQPLRNLLARAEYGTPHEFLERILSGDMDGRRKLVARLGHEALDPIGELINAAFLFEQNHNASLQGFLDWFDRGDVDVKREQAAASGEVRVMTVHGSKGLQAPLVVLADTTADPTKTPDRSFNLPMLDNEGERTGVEIPVLALRKEEKAGQLAEIAEKEAARDLEEHWRLLYVALTRAEERLVLAGSLGVRARDVPEHSWYAALDRALDGMGHEWEEHPEWGAVRRFSGADVAKEKTGDTGAQFAADRSARLAARAPAPVEARPPRPLAPSGSGEDDAAAAPPDPRLREAAERGRLLHGLFEHLPGADPAQRRELGLGWLARRAPDWTEAARNDLIDRASRVLDDPRWSAIFAPQGFGRGTDRRCGRRERDRGYGRPSADRAGPYPGYRFQDRREHSRRCRRGADRLPTPAGALCRRARHDLSGSPGARGVALFAWPHADRTEPGATGLPQPGLSPPKQSYRARNLCPYRRVSKFKPTSRRHIMATKAVGDDSFEQDVLKADGPVLVDFWAEWCGPCKMIGPALEEISEELGNVTIAQAQHRRPSRDAPAKYGVRGIPTMILFKDGQPVEPKVGAAPKAQIKSWLEAALLI